MQRIDVSFSTHDGLVLRGWLYRPAPAAGPRPGIVMTHGFSATREMGLPGHAERLAAAGYAVLSYDHRGLGESDGHERSLIDPFLQARDMMAAVAWLMTHPEVDAGRIGLWGTSYSGGEALVLAAIDSNVRAAATVVPMVAWPVPTADADGAAFSALAARVRQAEPGTARKGPYAVVPAPDTTLHALMPDPDLSAWMLREGAATGGRWRNEVHTPDWSTGPTFDPQLALPHLRAPVLMIVGSTDAITPAATVRRASSGIAQVELIEMEGHHSSFYEGAPAEAAATAIVDFYRRNL